VDGKITVFSLVIPMQKGMQKGRRVIEVGLDSYDMKEAVIVKIPGILVKDLI
jgi:hypothetical protein